MSPTEIPQEVLALSRQQMLEHKHHPVMQAIRRYLLDWVEAAKRDHAERWVEGSLLDPKQEEEAQIRARLHTEIANLQWETLAEFYGIDDQGTSAT